MPRSVILVDTNSYLRLAQTIRPFLNREFGEARYCLCIILELNRELGRQRLKSKFPWIEQPEHVAEREIYYRPPGVIQKAADRAFDYLWDHVQTELPGPSRVDVRYVAYALESDGTLVTDDLNMRKLAEEVGVRVRSSLELLRLMLDNGVVTPKTVRGLVDYWRFLGDTPSNMDAEYRRLFSEDG